MGGVCITPGKSLQGSSIKRLKYFQPIHSDSHEVHKARIYCLTLDLAWHHQWFDQIVTQHMCELYVKKKIFNPKEYLTNRKSNRNEAKIHEKSTCLSSVIQILQLFG